MVATPVRRASAHDPARARRPAALLRAVLLPGLAVPAALPAACGRGARGDAALQRVALLADRRRSSGDSALPHRLDADTAAEAGAERARARTWPAGGGLPRRARQLARPDARTLRRAVRRYLREHRSRMGHAHAPAGGRRPHRIG